MIRQGDGISANISAAHAEYFMPKKAAEPILLPFLKWAGGKRWLTANHSHLLPQAFERYVEPFLGGGAVFFHLRPRRAILSDANADLINTYAQIKLDWKKVHTALRRHARNHCKSYYYEERARQRNAPHEKAAQFLYLNRTCWNGLYRVNLRGEFNVPMGTKDSVLLDNDEFERTSAALKCATLRAADFESTIDQAKENDFIFIDPPYVTKHNRNGFAKYNEQIFTWTDQIRLSELVEKAGRRGALILITNADHPSIRALYSPLKAMGRTHILRRSSVLAADSCERGQVTEFAITINYETL